MSTYDYGTGTMRGLLLCKECGALVWSTDLHDQWHGYHGTPVDCNEVKVLFKGKGNRDG